MRPTGPMDGQSGEKPCPISEIKYFEFLKFFFCSLSSLVMRPSLLPLPHSNYFSAEGEAVVVAVVVADEATDAAVGVGVAVTASLTVSNIFEGLTSESAEST
jgi:hypothetical protein